MLTLCVFNPAEEMSKKNNLCDMHDPALEMRKWALELESVLSHGCCCRGKGELWGNLWARVNFGARGYLLGKL